MKRPFDSEPEVTTVWRGVSRCLMWAVVIVAVCVALALFKPQLNRHAKMAARIDELKGEKALAKEEYRRLRAQLDWVKTDPGYLEVHVRDRLDKAREGEWVVQFADK